MNKSKNMRIEWYKEKKLCHQDPSHKHGLTISCPISFHTVHKCPTVQHNKLYYNSFTDDVKSLYCIVAMYIYVYGES